MPELPEVETVKESLRLKLIGKKIRSAQILWDNIIAYPSKEEFVIKIGNKTITDIKRRGKFLIFDLDDYYLLSHLRMEGKYFFKSHDEDINKHEHVIFDLGNNEELRYMDTRKFGKMYCGDDLTLDTLNNDMVTEVLASVTGEHLGTAVRVRYTCGGQAGGADPHRQQV